MVGPSINASIKYGKDLFKHSLGSLPYAVFLSCGEIDGLDLLNHQEACNLRIIHNGDVEGKLPISVGQGTNDSKACVSVEKGIADNERRTPTSLFVSGLRIKCDGNELALLGNVTAHLPSLSTNWFSPLHFRTLVVLRNS